MVIGVDLDNTIACYDELFVRVTVERGLVPSGGATSKVAIKGRLQKERGPDEWTRLQGLVYGPRMTEAPAFAGAADFFHDCRARGVPVYVISHRTLHPAIGDAHDLHAAARHWLAARGFHDAAGPGLPPDRVYLEQTQSAKLDRIVERRCTHFIDDLPEVLEKAAAVGVRERVLFDPGGAHPDFHAGHRAESWAAVRRIVFPV